MVYRSVDLDLVFHALAQSTRRSILEQLAGGTRSISELAEPFEMTLPAVSKHIRVLERAGLAARHRTGRVHRIDLQPAPLADAVGWLEAYRVLWQERFDELARLVERRDRESAR